MLDFLKYFELVIQLLELDIHLQDSIEIAKYIEANPDKNYVFLHRYTFLFQAFLDLVIGEIDVEEFTKVGDVYSKTPLYKQENDSVLFFDKLKPDAKSKQIDAMKDSVVILDSSVWNIYQNADLNIKFSDNNIEVLSC